MDNQIKTSPLDDNFDGEKLLNEYETMSKEEAISLLGEEVSTILTERLKNRNISFEEFEELCHHAFPKYPERANWVKSIIYNKLSKADCLSMQGIEAEKIEMIVKMDEYKEKVKEGTITQSELKELCDMTFGKNSEESSIIYEKMKGLIQSKEFDDNTNHFKR